MSEDIPKTWSFLNTFQPHASPLLSFVGELVETRKPVKPHPTVVEGTQVMSVDEGLQSKPWLSTKKA